MRLAALPFADFQHRAEETSADAAAPPSMSSEARLALARALMLAACALTLANIVGVITALAWAALCAFAELANRRACAALSAEGGGEGAYLLSALMVSLAWSGLGALFWISGAAHGDLAALAIAMAVVAYACAFAHRSRRMVAAAAGPPIALGLIIFAGAGLSAPDGGASLMLALSGFCAALFCGAAVAACRGNAVRLLEARAELARARAALENGIAARTAELEAVTRRAEQANEAKSQFLAHMSHELRTPLNAVIGYAELMDEELAAEGNEPLRRDAQRIVASSRHLLKLVNDVLDLSKIEAQKLELDRESVDVAPVLAAIADSLRLSAGEQGNKIEVSVAPGLAPIWTDPLRLHQCVLNLASNACKFTSKGHIAIEANTVLCAGRAWLAISVRDTGVGMSSETLARLFAPFTQADAGTARRFGGTGLGLSITRRLAALMGGDVQVKSKEGEGSTFTLLFPHESAPAKT